MRYLGLETLNSSWPFNILKDGSKYMPWTSHLHVKKERDQLKIKAAGLLLAMGRRVRERGWKLSTNNKKKRIQQEIDGNEEEGS